MASNHEETQYPGRKGGFNIVCWEAVTRKKSKSLHVQMLTISLKKIDHMYLKQILGKK